MPSPLSVVLVACGALLATLYRPVSQKLRTFGVFRGEIVNNHGVEELLVIDGTVMCEDLHVEKRTKQLFAACQRNATQRPQWFPPMNVWTDPKAVSGGSLVRVDPDTFTSTELELTGFDGPFITHGIDILSDPEDPEVLWLFAVNHLPDPGRYDVDPPVSKSPERPHIEIFRHVLGTDEAAHVRSVRHPLIQMPNDILATSPSSFYVSNDHVSHEGAFRTYEDLSTQGIGPSTTTIHVEVLDLDTKDPTAGLRTEIAMKSIHNNNGLGRGRPTHPEEVVLIDASSGVMHRTKRDLEPGASKKLTDIERIQLDSSLDNPFYYDDPYATAGNNASGYLLPGMLRAVTSVEDIRHNDRPIASVVWHVRAKSAVEFQSARNEWEKRMIFCDDGDALRTASGSVMLPIDPASNGGKKQAWLFVTGFGSLAMVAAKVDL